MADTGRDFRAVELSNVKKSVRAPTEDEADLAVALDFIKQSPTQYLVWCLMTLAHSAFQKLQLVDLAIVLAHLPLISTISEPRGVEIARNAVRVDVMRLLESEGNSRVLRNVAECILNFDVGVNFLQPIEKCPTHDPHERRVFERLAALDPKFDLAVVICRMTCRTQRDQIVRSVAARLSTLDVMNVENRIATLAMAMLTLMHSCPSRNRIYSRTFRKLNCSPC